MTAKEKKYIKINRNIVVIGVIIILAITGFNVVIMGKNIGKPTIQSKVVEANLLSSPMLKVSDLDSEVYTEFLCTCCDKPLEDCDCGMADGMRKWLKEQVSEGITKDELLVKASKKFGMKAIEHEGTKEAIKETLMEQAGSNPPEISIPNAYYNFGTVKQSNEKLRTTFEVINTGKSDLIIDNMDTSCMCTTATLTVDGVEGPVFGMSMHGNNPKNWQAVIPPENKAILTVYYDPMAHGVQKKDSMLITRTVTLSSNDPVNFQKQVRIELEQVK